MEEILKFLEYVEDERQSTKVKHKMSDIIMIVFLGTLSNTECWTEIEDFAKMNEDLLRKYIGLENRIPSHDTMQRVFAIINPSFLENFQTKWNEMLNTNEGKKVKKLLAIDGKMQRGNGNKNNKANHIVSVVDEDGICLTQKLVKEKSNEITA